MYSLSGVYLSVRFDTFASLYYSFTRFPSILLHAAFLGVDFGWLEASLSLMYCMILDGRYLDYWMNSIFSNLTQIIQN